MALFSRRQFLEGSAALVGVTLAGCGAKPPQAPTSRAGEGNAIILTGVGVLEAGQGRAFTFPGGEPGLVFTAQNGTKGAVSALCTHAGCNVEWDGRAKTPLRCPCHESKFDLDGKVLSGPAKGPLKKYSVTANGEELTLRPL